MPMGLARDTREAISLPARTGPEGRSKGAEELFPLLSLRQVHGDRVVFFDPAIQTIEEVWDTEGDALITRPLGLPWGSLPLTVCRSFCMIRSRRPSELCMPAGGERLKG